MMVLTAHPYPFGGACFLRVSARVLAERVSPPLHPRAADRKIRFLPGALGTNKQRDMGDEDGRPLLPSPLLMQHPVLLLTRGAASPRRPRLDVKCFAQLEHHTAH